MDLDYYYWGFHEVRFLAGGVGLVGATQAPQGERESLGNNILAANLGIRIPTFTLRYLPYFTSADMYTYSYTFVHMDND